MLQSYLDVIKHWTLGDLFTENLYRPTLDDGEFNQKLSTAARFERRVLRRRRQKGGDRGLFFTWRACALGGAVSVTSNKHWYCPCYAG